MIQKKATVAFIAVILIASGCVYLNRLQKNQTLSKPGVKLANLPLFDEEGKVVTNLTVGLPLKMDGFQSQNVPVSQQELNVLPKDTLYGKRKYFASSDPGFSIATSVVLMGTDRTSIHKPEFCLVAQGWKIEKKELIQIPLSKPFPCELPAMKFTASINAKINGEVRNLRGIYIFWFVSEELVTASHWKRNIWLARDLLRKGVLNRWAYISFFSYCFPAQEEKLFGQMKSFIAASVPEFQTAWPETSPPGKVASATEVQNH